MAFFTKVEPWDDEGLQLVFLSGKRLEKWIYGTHSKFDTDERKVCQRERDVLIAQHLLQNLDSLGSKVVICVINLLDIIEELIITHDVRE